MAESTASSDDEPFELARFRQEWLAELRSRKAGTAGRSGSHHIQLNDAQSSSKAAFKAPAISAAHPQVDSAALLQEPAGTPSAYPKFTPSAHLALAPLPDTLGAALNIYRQAVNHEQSGKLDDALYLYRQAFRMDAHVDRVYHREEMLASISAAQQDTLQKSTVSVGDSAVDELTDKTQALSVKTRGDAPAVRVTRQAISTLLESFALDLSFEPEIEEEPVHLQKVPDELLVMFLRKLDITSIERFASVSRKARVITLDSAIWRELVGATYKPPQVANIGDFTSVLERCLYDYRRVYIEHPRVRLDGVYIATCHYTRPGHSENSWVNISHLVTYHRYIRFFPNGQVLSLLANEEHTPQQVIPLLKPTLRMKGFYIGTWRLLGTTIHLSNLLDASGRFPLPSDDPSAEYAPVEGNRYTFVMTLSLVSKPLGRWNRMNIDAYNSVNLETGDIHPVALKHERPFWFSKVRSYSLY